MKKRELKLFISSLSTPLYSFAYALTENEASASQLVLDATLSIFLAEKEVILSFSRESASSERVELLRDHLKPLFLKKIYALAKKRMEGKIQTSPHRFFSAEIEERATLYLRHRERMEYAQIESILDIPRHEFLSALGRGRELVGELR